MSRFLIALLAVLSLTFTGALTGCEKEESSPMQDAAQQADDAAKEAQESGVLEDATKAAEDAAEEAGKAAEDAAQSLQNAIDN
ncbi:MAG: hypothetical protein ACYTGQ_06780 [Planctomycetota bacterium]